MMDPHIPMITVTWPVKFMSPIYFVKASALLYKIFFISPQEDMNRGKPNWEHLNEDLHVLITVEDARNRGEVKLQRAVEEVRKLLVPAVSCFSFLNFPNFIINFVNFRLLLFWCSSWWHKCTESIRALKQCRTEAQFCQNLYMIKKESLPDRPKFCWSGSAVWHLFWRLQENDEFIKRSKKLHLFIEHLSRHPAFLYILWKNIKTRYTLAHVQVHASLSWKFNNLTHYVWGIDFLRWFFITFAIQGPFQVCSQTDHATPCQGIQRTFYF